METILVLSERPIEFENLKSLVSEMGGRWDDIPTLNQGVIQRGSSAIYFSPPSPPGVEYSVEELSDVADRIGNPPHDMVVINIGHGEGSVDLALEFANTLVQRWGGLVDDNGIFDNEGI